MLIKRNVRVRLRYILPAAQVTAALVLYYLGGRWYEGMRHVSSMPGTSPFFTLLVSLNAPLALVRGLYYRHVPELWDRWVFVSAIAILWYWVALNVESWRRDRKVLAFSRFPLRLTADLLLIALGAFWGFVFAGQGRQIHMDLEFAHPLFVPCVLGLLLAWSLALIFFFGRDLIQCVRDRLHS